MWYAVESIFWKGENLVEAILILFLLFCAVLFGIFVVYFARNGKRIRAEVDRKEAKEAEREFATEELRVTVVSQSCRVLTTGIKNPKAVREFTVMMQKEDGTLFNLPVPEEAYEGFEEGQTGLLTLVEGELYSFELDGNTL